MPFALRFLFRRQLAAGGEGAILRGALQIVGIGRRGIAGRRGRQAERATPGFDADHEALQILLLLGGESGVGHYRAGCSTPLAAAVAGVAGSVIWRPKVA